MASSSFEFKGDGLTDLSLNLREAAAALQSETDKTVWEVGAELAAGAKIEAKKHSDSIPPTIKVDFLPGAARVHAGGGTSPLPVLYELGNRKSTKRGDKYSKRSLTGPVTKAQSAGGQRTRQGFAHPVYGNKNVWVVQESFPFLRPTLKAMRPQITRRMHKAWDEALKPLTRK